MDVVVDLDVEDYEGWVRLLGDPVRARRAYWHLLHSGSATTSHAIMRTWCDGSWWSSCIARGKHVCLLGSAGGLFASVTGQRVQRFYEHLGWRPDGSTKIDDRGDFTLTAVRYATTLV